MEIEVVQKILFTSIIILVVMLGLIKTIPKEDLEELPRTVRLWVVITVAGSFILALVSLIALVWY